MPATRASTVSSASSSAVSARARQAEGAQRAEDRAALLEGEADGGVDDEEADGEGEEAEGGQVQVEAVGQPRDVALAVRCAALEVWGDLGEVGGAKGAGRQNEVGDFAFHAKQLLDDPDVGKRRSGGQRRVFAKRWQVQSRKALGQCRGRREAGPAGR